MADKGKAAKVKAGGKKAKAKTAPRLPTSDLAIVGIGASAGGLEALRQMFEAGRETDGLAFVVVQHLDPTHESLMAQLIERYTTMGVRQAHGGETVEAGQIYVIPPGHGLAIEDGVLLLTEFKDPRGMRRPIDDFFESLGLDQGPMSACVILSGTGADGSRGLRAIKEHGGVCVAQDPETARYDGMPISAVGTGLVDFVKQPADIIHCLRSYFDRRRTDGGIIDEAREVADHVDDMCEVLRDTIGHDFSGYKRTTLVRRIARRMQVLGIDEASEYLARIRGDEAECDALFRDLLINVTRFFRDMDAFEVLRTQVIEPLVDSVDTGQEIRVWTPGCSSGEEAYSIAMLFADAMKKADKRPYVQIFATDIDDKMLQIAREAVYPVAALSDIPAKMRAEYIIGQADSFTVTNHIRDMVRFSSHSLTRDPPFSKIDFISCRNLLIYFDENLQKQVVPLFHFALKESGKLFLGSSEGIGRFDELFSVVDQQARLFKRRDVVSRYSLQPPQYHEFRPRRSRLTPVDRRETKQSWVETNALRKLAGSYAPISMLVDTDGNLIERWGAIGRYLDFPDRVERRIHAPSLAKPGLREVLGALLRSARASGMRGVARDIEVETDFGKQKVAVVIDPVGDEGFLLVIRETAPLDPFSGDEEFQELDRSEGHVGFLEEELEATRHRLRSTVEELETTNEELKSSNEEMMSMNEELQSTNEELTTVNDELKTKVDQLTMANSDLKNFFDSTELAVLVVDDKLRLRSSTDAARAIFPNLENERGAPLSLIASTIEGREYVDRARDAAAGTRSGEYRAVARGEEDREYIVRALPYRRLDGSIEGATLIFTDVTEALMLERDLQVERERLRLALDVARIGVWEYDPASDETKLDATERELLGLDPDDPGDKMEPIIASLAAEDRDKVNKALRQAMDGNRIYDQVFRVRRKDGEVRWLHGQGRRLDSGARQFIGVTYDVTAEHELLEQREMMIREMNHRVKNLFAVVASLVSIAAREADDVDELAEDLRARIHALGRSHALTIRGAGEAPVTLDDLLEASIDPSHEDQEVSLKGQPVTINPVQLTPLALVLHEWATNATKYGALSSPEGKLAVEWARDGELLTIEWSETFPKGEMPPEEKLGFGSRLLEATTRQLHGTMEKEAGKGSYKRRLSFPLQED